jgi:epoxyqueuosine reductase
VNPTLLVPGCQSIIAVLMNYFPSEKQLSDAPQIAKYAYSKIDYHQVLKTKLQQLEKAITEKFGKNCFNNEVQHIFVDSAPVLERRWAEKAGLGWIGKNK